MVNDVIWRVAFSKVEEPNFPTSVVARLSEYLDNVT